MTIVRTLRESEAMPEGFDTGFEKMPFMRDWCWIAEKDGKAVAILIAAPCHGIVYLMRLSIAHGQSIAAVPLLRRFLTDARARGFMAYLVHLDPTRAEESKLIGVCRKAGGTQVMLPQVAVVGFLSDAGKF
jgi:hypothetical protein